MSEDEELPKAGRRDPLEHKNGILPAGWGGTGYGAHGRVLTIKSQAASLPDEIDMAQPETIPTTDPAFEFAALAKAIKDHGINKGGETNKGIAGFIGIDSSDTRFFEILGLIGTRSVAMVKFIASIQDDYLDEDLRGSLIAGVKTVSQIISPANLMQPYNQVVNGYIPDQDVRLIRSFSQTARRYRPLRVFNDQQRSELSIAADEALRELF